MTDKQTSSSRTGHAEFLLSSLTDDTPPSSSDESGGDQDDQKNPRNEKQENLDKVKYPEPQEEGMCKFEKEAINKILAVKSEVEKIKEVISSAEKEDLARNFKMYEEILISKTLILDSIQTRGVDKIKELRKETIIFVQDCLNLLDLKKN